MSLISMSSGILIGGGIGKGRCRQSNPSVASVVDGVESLEKDLAEDEVHSRSTLGTNVSNNQIYITGDTTNIGVEATRPDLSIRSNFERNLGEKERAGILSMKFRC